MGVGSAYVGIGAAQGLSKLPENRRRVKKEREEKDTKLREKEGLEALRAFATMGDPEPMAKVFNKYSGGGQVNFRRDGDKYVATGVSPKGEAYKDQVMDRDDMAVRFLAWFDPKGALAGNKGDIKAVAQGTDLVNVKGGKAKRIYRNPAKKTGKQNKEDEIAKLVAYGIPREAAVDKVYGLVDEVTDPMGLGKIWVNIHTGKRIGRVDEDGRWEPLEGSYQKPDANAMEGQGMLNSLSNVELSPEAYQSNAAVKKIVDEQTSKIAQITTDDDYDKLQSGEKFMDPQGKIRVKP